MRCDERKENLRETININNIVVSAASTENYYYYYSTTFDDVRVLCLAVRSDARFACYIYNYTVRNAREHHYTRARSFFLPITIIFFIFFFTHNMRIYDTRASSYGLWATDLGGSNNAPPPGGNSHKSRARARGLLNIFARIDAAKK